MAVDSIGSSATDAALAERRRRLAEDQAKELDKIENKHREEVSKVEIERQKQLADLYDNQRNTIEEQREIADHRVDQAKAAADARIREYDRTTSSMTEEAKRQFQAKADLLNRSSQEMDNQRAYLMKQQAAATQKLREDHELALSQNQNRYNREATESYLNQQHQAKNLSAQGAQELTQLKQELAQQKAQEMVEHERALHQLKLQQEGNLEGINHEIESGKKTGEMQLSRERSLLELERMSQGEKYQGELAELRRQNEMAVNKTHIQGKKQLAYANDFYGSQVETERKDATQKVKAMQNRTSGTLQNLEAEDKLQEGIAAKSYMTRKQQLAQNRDQTLKDFQMRNEQIKETLDKESLARTQALVATREKAITAQADEMQSDIKFQRAIGQRQINDAIANNSKHVADHGSKSTDPFYTLQRFAAQVSESDLDFTVQIAVPQHEQDSVRLTQQQGYVTLSGSRRHEDKAVLADGHKIATNSYQSYSENIPTHGHLDFSRMARVYADGVLTFRIPKG